MNITETWLTKAITNEADIEGYNMFRCDRTDNIKGGGVAIYIYTINSKLVKYGRNDTKDVK